MSPASELWATVDVGCDAATMATTAELTCAVRRYPPMSGWPPVELPRSLPLLAAGLVPPDLAIEVDVLAGLLAEVVQLAADHAIFPDRLAQIAELAMEHDSVRRAACTLDRELR